jgi:PAS domain S-box-containing protein
MQTTTTKGRGTTFAFGGEAMPPGPSRRGLGGWLRWALPSGRSLPDEVWARRHHALLAVVWLHAPAIFVFALARGYGVAHSLFEGGVLVAIASVATIATLGGHSRKVCSGLVSLELLTASAVVVHISGGLIEAHFHFFVMMSVLLLYEDWFPFLLAFAYVVVHHGIAGTLDPTSVYNHAGALNDPVKWAVIHGTFISAAGAANIIAWRLNEEIRTENRNAYREARESEERFRSAFEHAPIGVTLQDLSGHWLQVNRAFCEILGRPREQLIGLDSLTLTHPDDVAADEALLRDLLTGEARTAQVEKRYRNAGGHLVWCVASVSLVRDDAGCPLHLITQVEDITVRKRTEQYLEAQRTVALALAEGGSETEVFPKLLHALGGAMGWERGTVWTRSDDPETLRVQQTWHAPTVERGPFEETGRDLSFCKGVGLPGRVWATGEPAWIEDVAEDASFVRASAARAAGMRGAIALPVYSGGELYGVLELFDRELHRPDGELIGTLATISGQISQFVERRRAEQEAERLKDEFVALVSHELRSPLTSILGYLELLADGRGPLTGEQKQFVNVMRRNSSRLLRLVGDLLFIAQVGAGSLNLSLEELDLGSLARESSEAVRPEAEEKEIELIVSDESVPFVGDRARVAQLLDNLVSNALKFTPQGGRVEIRSFRSNGHVVLEVADSGVGIPTEEQDRLFQRFFRASSATQHAIPGTGLGLAVTKTIADAHGAILGVESTEGQGTTFRVEFPATRALPTVTPLASAPPAGLVAPRDH